MNKHVRTTILSLAIAVSFVGMTVPGFAADRGMPPQQATPQTMNHKTMMKHDSMRQGTMHGKNMDHMTMSGKHMPPCSMNRKNMMKHGSAMHGKNMGQMKMSGHDMKPCAKTHMMMKHGGMHKMSKHGMKSHAMDGTGHMPQG